MTKDAIREWDTTAANNTTVASINVGEGMSPGDVNNAIRAVMAQTAEWFKDSSGQLVSAGSGDAYTLTTNEVVTSLEQGQTFTFEANFTNTGAATLAVDGLAAKDIRKFGASDLAASDILENAIVVVAYEGTTDTFQMLTPPATLASVATGTAASIADTDNDTKIQTEEAADEDVIRFDVNGQEVATMAEATTSVLNTMLLNSTALTSTSNAVAVDGTDINIFTLTTTEATTISAPTNLVTGAVYLFDITVADVSHTISWNAAFDLQTTGGPAVTANGDKIYIAFKATSATAAAEYARTVNSA